MMENGVWVKAELRMVDQATFTVCSGSLGAQIFIVSSRGRGCELGGVCRAGFSSGLFFRSSFQARFGLCPVVAEVGVAGGEFCFFLGWALLFLHPGWFR